MILGDKKLLRRLTLFVLLLAAPALTGLDRVWADVTEFLKEPPAEQVSYEIEAGAWAHTLVRSEEIGRNPLKIFEWVRREVQYEPYGGARRGARGSFMARRGNAVDKAALLATLFESAGITWRLAEGDVRLPIADAEKWLGVKGADRIGEYLQASRVDCAFEPALPAAQWVILRKHVWVQVASDYFPAFGSRRDDSGSDPQQTSQLAKDPTDSWVDLDPTITFRASIDPLNLADLTGISSSEVLAMVPQTLAISGAGTSWSVLPRTLITDKTRQAGERLERNIAGNNEVLGRTAGQHLLANREELPGNMPAELVGVPKIIARQELLDSSSYFSVRREYLEIQLRQGNTVMTWDRIGLPRVAGLPVTLSFQVSSGGQADASQSYVDATAIPLMEGGFPVCVLEPSVVIGTQPQQKSSNLTFAYGQALDLLVKVTGPGGSDGVETIVPVTAGGVYSITPVDALSTQSAESRANAIQAVNEAAPMNLHALMLELAGQSVLHQMDSLERAGLTLQGWLVARPQVRAIVAGLEPAVTSSEAQGVRLVTWAAGARPHLIPLAKETELSRAAAGKLMSLLEDVALTGPHAALANNAFYQSPGRVMAFGLEDASQTYQRYAKDAVLTSGDDALISPLNSTAVRNLVHAGSVTFSGKTLFETMLDGERMPAGFAWWVDNGALLTGSAIAPEDERAISAWTAELRNDSDLVCAYPADLFVPRAGGQQGNTARHTVLRTNASRWARSVVGVSNAMRGEIAAASLLVGPWLDTAHPGALPAACLALHETAAGFARPRAVSLELTRTVEDKVVPVSIINTIETTDSVTQDDNAPGEFTATLKVNRLCELLRLTIENDALLQPPVPFEVYENPAEPRDTFDAQFAYPGNAELSLVQQSGNYEVRGFGEIGGLRSDVISVPLIVDNTVPTVETVELTGTQTGVFQIRGKIHDAHLAYWSLSWRKHQNPGAWQALSGYEHNRGNLPVERVLVSINSRALGWGDDENNQYDLLFTGFDEAGNRESKLVTLTVRNDLTKPVIGLTAATSFNGATGQGLANNGTLWDTTRVLADVADEFEGEGSLKEVRVWIENEANSKSRLDIVPGLRFDPAVSQYGNSEEADASRRLFSVFDLPRTSPDDRWSIKAWAKDVAGNEDTKVISGLKVGNVLWDFQVAPRSIRKDTADFAWLVFSATTPATWKYEIRRVTNAATGEVESNPVRTISSNVAVSSMQEKWNGKDNGGNSVPLGTYQVRLTLSYITGSTPHSESASKLVNVVNGNAILDDGPRISSVCPPRATAITSPTNLENESCHHELYAANKNSEPCLTNYCPGEAVPEATDVSSIEFGCLDVCETSGEISSDFFIEQGSDKPLKIWGRVGKFFKEAMDGSPKPRDGRPWTDLRDGFPDAFWVLEYKPSAAFPTMADVGPPSDVSKRYQVIIRRDNWRLIDWSTAMPAGSGDGSVNTVLASWDTSKLKSGYYDIRLWATDGTLGNTVHQVLGRIKVIPSSEGGGDPTGGVHNVGALTLSSTDLSVPFAGFTAEVRRDYNSKDAFTDGPLGYGWHLRGMGLRVDHSVLQGSGEQDEAYLTLPDGREFWFANYPVKNNAAAASIQNVWALHGEYLMRPFGLRLFRPGGSRAFHYPAEVADRFENSSADAPTLEPGRPDRHMEMVYAPEVGQASYNPGDIAYLQTEDKTWYIFEWATGDLVEIVHPDGHSTRFQKNQASPDGTASEIMVRDAQGRTLKIVRDTTTKRIKEVVDPIGNAVKYVYDKYGNLTEVADRTGFKRFYLYDTPETMAKFPDRDDLSGSQVHYLVDVRIDDDRSDAGAGIPRFDGDTLPDLTGIADPRAIVAKQVESQNPPGDTSIIRFKYDALGNVSAYETGAGNVDIDYGKNQEGNGTVGVTNRESGGTTEVTYTPTGKVKKVTDVYGQSKIYDYGTTADGIEGVLTSETNEVGDTTTYSYPTRPDDKTAGNFANQFRDFLNSKLTGECSGLYLPCDTGYTPQDGAGYLVADQFQPNTITQLSRSTADNIVTSIKYGYEQIREVQGNTPEGYRPAKDAKAWQFQPVAVTDPLGNVTTLAYDDAGHITSVVPPGSQVQDRSVKSYYYGGPGETGTPPPPVTTDLLYGTPGISGKLALTVAPNNQRTEYGYKVVLNGDTLQYEEDAMHDVAAGRYSYSRLDALGRVIESWSSSTAPDAQNNHANPSNREGYTKTTYDAEGRVIETVSEIKRADGTKAQSISRTYYDWQGRVFKTTSIPAPAKGEAKPTVETFTKYDDFGRVIETRTESVSADGTRTQTSRNSTAYIELPEGRAEGTPTTGRLERRTDNRGTVSESEYDSGGRLVASRQKLSDGALVEQTTYEYDAAGRQIASIDIDGNRVSKTYDEFGRITQILRNDQMQVENGFDAVTRQVWTKTLSGFESNGETPVYSYSSYVYKSEVPNLGAVIATYTNLAAAPGGGELDGTSSAPHLQFLYDDDGRRVAEKDQEDRWTYTLYDSEGRVQSVIMNWDGTTAVTESAPPLIAQDALSDSNLRFNFEYDAKGRQTAIVKPKGQRLEKVYDADGRLKFDVGPVDDKGTPSTSDDTRMVKWFEYDSDGRTKSEGRGTSLASVALTSLTSADISSKAQTAYTYDLTWGSVAEKRLYQNGALERREVYSYDKKYGDLVKVEMFGGANQPLRTVTYEYDARTGLLLGVNAPEGRIDYARDARGRIARLRTSTGIDTTYSYNAQGEISKLADHGLSASGTNFAEVAFSYDPLGRKTLVTRPNGTKTSYEYDGVTGWMKKIAHLGEADANQLTLDYTRDATGIISDIVETRGAETSPYSWHYDYDGLKRLTQAALSWNDGDRGMRYGYEYDRNGNRHSERIESYDSGVGQSWLVSSSTGYDYNVLDQLLASAPNSGDATAYAWDALGRVATETTGDKVQAFGWSADDHLLSVSHTTNATADWLVTYGYDHRGERVSRTDGADATRYLSDDENPTGYTQALAEVSADATTTKANYWYADGFGPIAEAHNPGSPEFSLAFLHGDHLSTTRGLTAAATGAFSQIDYTPFGSITSGGGSLTSSYAFTGQWKDPRTELQYHRCRWLHVDLGLWTSHDRHFDFPNNFGNPMAYAGNNPILNYDVNGRFLGVALAVAIAIFVIAAIVLVVAIILAAGATAGFWAVVAGIATIVVFIALLAIVVICIVMLIYALWYWKVQARKYERESEALRRKIVARQLLRMKMRMMAQQQASNQGNNAAANSLRQSMEAQLRAAQYDPIIDLLPDSGAREAVRGQIRGMLENVQHYQTLHIGLDDVGYVLDSPISPRGQETLRRIEQEGLLSPEDAAALRNAQETSYHIWQRISDKIEEYLDEIVPLSDEEKDKEEAK